MDKSKPIFPNYVSKKQPTGVLWDNKFRCMPPHCCTEADLHNSRFFFAPLKRTYCSGKKSSRLTKRGRGGSQWSLAFCKVCNVQALV